MCALKSRRSILWFSVASPTGWSFVTALIQVASCGLELTVYTHVYGCFLIESSKTQKLLSTFLQIESTETDYIYFNALSFLPVLVTMAKAIKCHVAGLKITVCIHKYAYTTNTQRISQIAKSILGNIKLNCMLFVVSKIKHKIFGL